MFETTVRNPEPPLPPIDLSSPPVCERAAPSPRDTKQRLLDAAERLFAERGFEGTSMRAVTRAAATSVSAANYHFGSKEALLRAALVRRLEPLNRRRLEALDELEAAAGDEPVAVEALLEAFLRPGYEAPRNAGEGRPPYRGVAARLYTDPHARVSSLKVELFGPVVARFIDALAGTLPHRPRDELVLDFQFVIGLLVHVISGHTRAVGEGGETPSLADEWILRHMVSFAAAGLRSGLAAEVSDRDLGADR